VIEHLSSMYKALGSILSTGKRKNLRRSQVISLTNGSLGVYTPVTYLILFVSYSCNVLLIALRFTIYVI
jgi:hypothetical protein